MDSNRLVWALELLQKWQISRFYEYMYLSRSFHQFQKFMSETKSTSKFNDSNWLENKKLKRIVMRNKGLIYLKSNLFSFFNRISHIIICSQGTGEVTCWKHAVLLIVNLFANISVNSKFLYLPNTCYIYAAMTNMVNQNY